MNTFVETRGGMVIPHEKAKDWLNEDGREHKDDEIKASNYSKLGTMEKVKAKEFLKKHPEFTSSKGRANMYKEDIATELLRLREENDKRRAENKPLLTEKQKELIVPAAGVISSRWRQEEIVKSKNEMARATDGMLRDASGLGQDR